jgi:uncharacterized protein DUF5670
MLLLLALILVILWAIGAFAVHTGLATILLIVALVVVIYHFLGPTTRTRL